MEAKAITQMLAQMRAMAETAGSATAGPAGAAGVDFGRVLKDALADVSRAQGQAQEMAAEFSAGSPQVSLQDVMIGLQKASLSFQQIVQVRNRLVSAYQEILNMPL